MAASLIVWRGNELLRYSGEAIEKGLAAAAVVLQAEARRLASVPNTGVRVPVRRQTRRGNRTSRTIYPHSARPGESPHVRTGRGQKGIVFGRISAKEYRVGYSRNVRYMFMHELGIAYSRGGYQRRPTIEPAARRAVAKMRAVAIAAAKAHKPKGGGKP